MTSGVPLPPPQRGVSAGAGRGPLQGELLSLPSTGPRTVTVEGVSEPVARVFVEGVPPHLDRTFDYLVPAGLDEAARPGCRVQVRFAGKDTGGVLVERGATTTHDGDLVPLRRVVTTIPVVTEQVLELCTAVAEHYAGTVGDVLRLAVPSRHATTETSEVEKADPPRTAPRERDAQAATVLDNLTGGRALLRRIAAGEGPKAVWTALPGTRDDGLGALAAAALAGGRGVLVVVPTARQVEAVAAALGARFPDEPVVRLLAEDGQARRYRAFLRVLLGRARIVVGTRAAALCPLRDPGVLVVWDDEDPALTEPRSPHPHARQVLQLRADLTGAALVLGSHSRSPAAQDLLARGVAHAVTAPRETLRRATPRVEAPDETDLARDGGAGAARIPPAAFHLVRRALERGPVLVQVASGGYVPVVACARCREAARCTHCAGPLQIPAPVGAAAGAASPAAAASTATCRRCGRLAAHWACPTCGADHLRARSIGSARTASELGRAFPGVPVIASGTTTDYGIVDRVDSRPRLVVATPGAEPEADDGYAAALILDAGQATSRPELGATSRALRRWFHAASLVRPAPEGGRVMLLGHPARAAALTLVRWDPASAAERDLEERAALHLPPAVAAAALEGPPEAVADYLDRLEHDATDHGWDVPEVLGPVPVSRPTSLAPRSRGAGTQDEAEDLVRAVVRAGPRGSASARQLSDLLRATTAARSLRRSGRPVRVQVDPEDLW